VFFDKITDFFLANIERGFIITLQLNISWRSLGGEPRLLHYKPDSNVVLELCFGGVVVPFI